MDPFCLFYYFVWAHYRFIIYYNTDWIKFNILFNKHTIIYCSEKVGIKF